jgi:hypothetical protein
MAEWLMGGWMDRWIIDEFMMDIWMDKLMDGRMDN